MRKLFVLFFVILIMFSFCPAMASDSYAQRFNQKFQRGAVNALLGWSKIFTVPYESSSQDPNAWSTFGRGLYEGVGCTFSGLYNFIFSPTPLNELKYPGGGVLNQ